MDFKKIVWLFVFFVAITKNISAQTDSTDLNFHSAEISFVTSEDYIKYSDGNFVELILEFDLDTANFGRLYIELSFGDFSSVLESVSYSLEELESLELLDVNAVFISFGIRELAMPYQVSLTIESNTGSLGESLTKVFLPL